MFNPLSRRDIKFNEGKNLMKNKMKKGVKIDLPLALKNCSSRRVADCVKLAVFG